MRKFAFFLMAVSFGLALFSCEKDIDYDVTRHNPYVFTGEYKMIKIPVPEGGIEFPVGINDDQTARVEKPFYIGEILVTHALWDTVARWAVNEKEVGKYYNLIYDHNERYLYSNLNERYLGGDLPILDEHGFGYLVYIGTIITISGKYVIPVWCNAFTEWYNEQYGTNLTPVYLDEYGNPKRSNAESYLQATKDSTGFRLATPEEWELAARWNGNDSINTVNTAINGINFSNYPIKFTKGNSASGARTSIDDLVECGRVAVFSYNNNYLPVCGKTKSPNALGIYDMSGNLSEFTMNYWTNSQNCIQRFMGGAYNSKAEELAVGRQNDGTFYWGVFGLRLVRNGE
jgi:formylglycine-generating enzyme required for sulfatase activity